MARAPVAQAEDYARMDDEMQRYYNRRVAEGSTDPLGDCEQRSGTPRASLHWLVPRVQVANAIYAIPIGDKWIKPVAPSVYVGDWPYADDGDRGLPAWFFPVGTAQDILFNSIELYSDGSAVWTGGMGVIWKLPQGAKLNRAQLGKEFDRWSLENL